MIPKTATNKHQQAPATNKLQAGHQQACNLYAASTSTTIRVHLEGISTTPTSTSKQDTSTSKPVTYMQQPASSKQAPRYRYIWRVSVPHQHQQAGHKHHDTGTLEGISTIPTSTSKPVTCMKQPTSSKHQHQQRTSSKQAPAPRYRYIWRVSVPHQHQQAGHKHHDTGTLEGISTTPAPASNKLQAGHQQACNLYAASTSN